MSWGKIKLGDFLINRESRFKPKDKVIDGLKRIDKIDFSGTIYLSEKPSNTDMIVVKNGDLVISGINIEKGAMSVYEGQEDVTATIHYSSYRFDEKKIDIEFLKYFLRSPEFKEAIKEQVPGGIKTEIKPKHLLPLEVVIPTNLKEQKKVILEYKKVENTNSDISIEITNQQSLVKQLRQSFLREAMQGKLVKQDKKDGYATDLLKKIKAEKEKLIAEKKLKKEKELPPIKPEEIPFDIPENWVWCRLGALRDLKFSLSYGVLVPGNDIPNGVPFVRVQDLDFADKEELPSKHISPEIDKQYSRTKLVGGEILICVVGSIGKVALASERWIGANIARAVCRFMPNKNLSRKYLFYCLTSPFIQNFFQNGQKSINPTLNVNILETTLIPLPPLSEQNRIVKKLEQLMQTCDDIEQRIKQSQKQNVILLQQALREALSEK